MKQPSFLRKRSTSVFLCGCGLGLLVFLFLYGFSPLNVTNDIWLRGGFVEKDCIQHYAGWLFYRQSPLSFPFCVTNSVNWPDGISVAYTDSIPLFAAFFRFFSPLLPDTFQYFGLFTLLCFMLQGGFAALLLSLFTPNRIFAITGSILFLFSPVLVERAFRHTSLAAQFLILWALYEYIHCTRQKLCFSGSLFACNILSVTIHPYFTGMTLAISLALLLDSGFFRRKFLPAFAGLFAYIAGCFITALCFGFATGSSSGGSDVEYGYFNMNLNALWNPISRWHTVWSRFLPVQNQVGGNYDAFNYLGLGVLVCLAVIVMYGFLHRKLVCLQLPGFAARHLGLALMCMCCTVFAVSHVVTANGATLFRLPLSHKLIRLCTVFRSSGRMFWPVYYLIFLCCAVFLLRVFSSRNALIGLCLLLSLQLVDISPALFERSREMRFYTTEYASPLTSDFWGLASRKYSHLISMDGIQEEPLFLAIYAAQNGMTTNDPFAARYNSNSLALQREALTQEILSGTLQDDCLYLISNEGLFWQLSDAVQDKALCGKLDDTWYVIAPGMEYSRSDFLPYGANYPLHTAEYTDDNWQDGILQWDHQTLLFYDCAFTRRNLANATALRLPDGSTYTITDFSDRDKGWLMVTLDIPDATPLAHQNLESIQ